MAQNQKVDSVSGTATTGHEWDGIKELNTPLPRWWVWLFYATIVWSIGYWIVYPAWPTISGFTAGLWNYSSRAEVAADLAALQKVRGEKAIALAAAPLAEIEKDPALLAFARAQGKSAFGDHCAACHGTGATGSKGYPNLNDDEWEWEGTIEGIHQTIQFGVRSEHPETRGATQMPPFGKDGTLKKDEIVQVANYVRSLAGLPVAQGVDLAAGQKVFADNCTSCHGENGKGNHELGAPDLTDKIWLYGSGEAAIVETVTNGRGGVMPAWIDRLDAVTIKSLAVYVHSLGGGK